MDRVRSSILVVGARRLGMPSARRWQSPRFLRRSWTCRQAASSPLRTVVGVGVDYTQIVYDVDDRVATITLDRPEQLNAFTGTMMREMIDAFDRADADDDGAGGHRHRRGARRSAPAPTCRAAATTFADGGSDVQTAGRRAARRRRAASRCGSSSRTKPVIAAINGAGRRRRRHDDAADGHPPRQHDGPLRVRVRPPRHRARGVLVVVPAARRRHQPGGRVGATPGRVFAADEALAGGLVRSVHAPDDLLPAARALAARDRRQHRAGVGRADAADDVAHARRRPPDGGAPRRLAVASLARGRSADAREGVTSFLEKRAAGVPDRRSATACPTIFPEWDEPEFS